MDYVDREKTSFIRPDGLCQFKIKPFRSCNAPATFELKMDALLHSLKWHTCFSYLDDDICFFQDWKSAFRDSLLSSRFAVPPEFNVMHQSVVSDGANLPPLVISSTPEGVFSLTQLQSVLPDFPQPIPPKDAHSFIGRSMETRSGQPNLPLHQKTEKCCILWRATNFLQRVLYRHSLFAISKISLITRNFFVISSVDYWKWRSTIFH